MNTMPAGRYYVGDLCYVMDDVWDEVCDLMFSGSSNGRGEYGKFKLKDGREFAVYSTAYGDGTYFDNSGREYWVDAGVIGCILESNIRDPNPSDGGNYIDFYYWFDTGEDGGMIWFGDVFIDTVGNEDEEENPDYD